MSARFRNLLLISAGAALIALALLATWSITVVDDDAGTVTVALRPHQSDPEQPKRIQKTIRKSVRQNPSNQPIVVEVPTPVIETLDLGLDSDWGLEAKASPWRDSVNQEVLGDPKWMAQPSKRLQDQIKDALKRAASPPDPRISPPERRSAIEALRPVVDECYEEAKQSDPSLIGRVVVVFEASAATDRGTIRNVRFGPIVRLDAAPSFEECVLSNAEGLTFPAEHAGEPRTIEYPFFYDGSY